VSSKVTTRLLSETDYPAWNALLIDSAEGSIYSSPEYLEILTSEIDATFKILVAERGGEMVGGIALVERKNSWGTYVGGRLLLYYNGFVLKPQPSKYPSERTAKRLEILTALEEAITSTPYGRIQIKSRSSLQDVRIFIRRGWEAHPSFTYVVRLDDLEAAWSRMEQNLRRLVTRCTREGFQFTEDDDFESFYRLHHLTHVRKGAAIYLPEAAFHRYFSRLRSQDLCRLFHARTDNGRVISTQLVLLGKHPVCHTVSAGTDTEFLKTGATAFLRWKVFERLAGMGYKANDLTDAELNPVSHFKSQLGGDLEMNMVLDRPDRGRFRLQKFVYHTGSLAKRSARALLTR
jgi:hypothetical protein